MSDAMTATETGGSPSSLYLDRIRTMRHVRNGKERVIEAILFVAAFCAVAVTVAETRRRPHEVMVTLSTAHPAKFPDAVRLAIGLEPPVPPPLADLLKKPERFEVLANDLMAVERFVESRTRAVSAGHLVGGGAA